ncbi:potassium channel family protein [Desulfoluna spongiiphila]|uniref:Voltage-gated potassium channel n=1 Tax=Desulfoluna spongiiphila TaxID=419481 RepID=A0A1G5CTJ1_9BACT|nr:potassium channel family protein [Desulfoluna spongiiphila]SCY05694.1 voltage-gated potassium channel [Desulfoluna spongiiphila]VVS92400.1 potassium channel domain [Desulfoluna spongiiphila]
MEFTLTFIRFLFWALYFAAPLMLFLLLVIIALGQGVGRLEKWGRFDALYWTFITATTVGYGDMRPVRRMSRTLSVLIALTGIMFTGILVAMTLHTATMAFERHVDMGMVKEIKKQI